MGNDAERTLDLSANPASVQDQLDSLRQLKQQISGKEAHFNRISEEQRQKYLAKMTILPTELSSMIAKIRISMATLHEEIADKEKELENACDLRHDYQTEMFEISA